METRVEAGVLSVEIGEGPPSLVSTLADAYRALEQLQLYRPIRAGRFEVHGKLDEEAVFQLIVWLVNTQVFPAELRLTLKASCVFYVQAVYLVLL